MPAADRKTLVEHFNDAISDGVTGATAGGVVDGSRQAEGVRAR